MRKIVQTKILAFGKEKLACLVWLLLSVLSNSVCAQQACPTTTGNSNVINAGNAIDQNDQTYSILRVTRSIWSSATQTISFQGAATDSIRLKIGAPGGLPSYVGISIDIYNNSQQIAKQQFPTNGSITFDLPEQFDQITITFSAFLASSTVDLYLYSVERIPSRPALMANPVEVCKDKTATLRVAPPATYTFNYRWYDESGNLISNTSGTTYTTPILAVGAHQYYVSAVNSLCGPTESTKQPVTVIVYPKPGPPEISITSTKP